MTGSVRLLVMARSLRHRSGPFLWRLFFLARYPNAKALHNVETDGDEEDRQERRRQHAANDDGTQHLPRDAASAGCDPQGTQPRMKANAVIRMGRSLTFAPV